MMLDVWVVTSGTLSRQYSFDCIFFYKDIEFLARVFLTQSMQSFFAKYAKTLHLVWHADETGLLAQNAGGDGFFITFCLRVPQATVEVVLIRVMNGVAWFFEVDCVEETFHLIWHADETVPHRQSAGGGGFYLNT